MGVITAKFGGSSLADAAQFKRVKAIVDANPDRRYVVPSAPGKRFPADDKITDYLYACEKKAAAGEAFEDIFTKIKERYTGIEKELGLKTDIAAELDRIYKDIAAGATADYTASRGEYLNALLLADYLGYEFIDAAKLIAFDADGVYDDKKTAEQCEDIIAKHEKAVIPGFYGAKPDGSIKTFSRGGSDITGSIIARAAHSTVYENWTDTCGFLMTDPRIVDDPVPIDELTYRELRELSYMGATVLHEDAIFPVHKSGIPINIRNTNMPDHPGTMIVGKKTVNRPGQITGIAGLKGFTVITVEKSMMNSELGFGRRALNVLEDHFVSFEHMPSGIDTLSIIISNKELDGKLDSIVKDLDRVLQPDSIEVHSNLALIATVGHGMSYFPGMAARLFNGLRDAGVNVRMIDQGSSELNIIVGVEEDDFEEAVRAIYSAFMAGR